MSAPARDRPTVDTPAARPPLSTPAPVRTPARRRVEPMTVAVAVVGIVLTALATLSAVQADRNTERRLLQTQTRQAAAVIAGAVSTFEQTLGTALDVQAAVGDRRGPRVFEREFAKHIGPTSTFVEGSLWHVRGRTVRRIARLGPDAALSTAEAARIVRHAMAIDTTAVRRVERRGRTIVAYVLADRTRGNVVFAERLIPADRRAPVDRDAAFADLDYATYLGMPVGPSTLSTTDVPLDRLPLGGLTARAVMPFGDNTLTLVARPKHHLSGPLSQRLPAVFLIGGLLLTGAAILVVRKLVGARRRADDDTATIRSLYDRVDAHYGAQRDLFERLQRALLPQVNPNIPGVELATEYVAGAQGIDIGGDWYSAIGFGDENFAFVVGDVSGHGIDTVAEMARARFTLRAHLLDGNSPQAVLEKCSRQFDIATDGHLVTAIVGVGNWRTGEVTVANAGHPLPLLAGDGEVGFVQMPVGPPLGVGWNSYEPATFTLTPGSTLIAYTDGLIERRNEGIDVGMTRLVDTVRPRLGLGLGTLVQQTIKTMRGPDASDDIAVLAVRRPGAWHRFDAGPATPAAARRFVKAQLAARPVPTGVDTSDIVLVASELVTNSVRAGATVVDVDVRLDASTVEVVVEDDAPGWPVRSTTDHDALSGRGLAIVEEVAARWSIARRPRGKSVTATFEGRSPDGATTQ